MCTPCHADPQTQLYTTVVNAKENNCALCCGCSSCYSSRQQAQTHDASFLKLQLTQLRCSWGLTHTILNKLM
jgi:hypothetical protein